ncbi:DUF4192 family protein [Microbacterium sp.]|uniref:DUF4192 family protein n=1 Tax=Microbacterium sp. TaxID=51671 RepID=UPI0039E68D1F
MTTILKASDSAEFLGIIPALAGFAPTSSLVLLPFHGKRTYGALRLDLPDDECDAEYADTAVGLVTKVDDADAVAVVVYVDDVPQSTHDGLVLPRLGLVDDVLAAVKEAGLRLVDALCVMPHGWASYLEDDPELLPLPEAHAAARDHAARDQRAGAGLPLADLAEKERVGRAVRDLDAVLDRDGGGRLDGSENPQALAALTLLEDMTWFFESLLEDPAEQPPFVTAALLWCLHRPILRDVALLQWATSYAGGEQAFDEQLDMSTCGGLYETELNAVMIGRGPRPDPARLERALEIVRLAAARAPRAMRAGPLTLAAWFSWALGRSTHAGVYLALVREIDPGYGLAGLIRTVIDAGMLPEWVFRRGPRYE